MTTENTTFAGSDGQMLAARLDLPPDAPRAVALMAHCFSCGKDLRAAQELAARLTDHGFAVLRFDFTGLGESEGEFADTNFSSNVADLVAAADWLRQTYAAPSLLVGHSLGGAAALAAAPRIPELAAVVVIGAPSDPGHITDLFDDTLGEITYRGEADVSIAGRTFTVKKQLLDDVAQANLEHALNTLDRPLLILHSPDDAVVGIDNAMRLFELASHPKSVIALDGADHLLSDPRQAARAADLLAAWAGQHLPDRLRTSDDVLVPAAEGEVVVAERGTGPFAQVIRVGGRHVLLADEPLGIGDDTGPAPYDLLLGALGACTAMTLRMYADRKGWPLDHVSVRLSHDKIHAEDCATCETKAGKVDAIDRRVILVGPLDDDQRAKLLEIAEKCPVHRTLHAEVHITTALQAP